MFKQRRTVKIRQQSGYSITRAIEACLFRASLLEEGVNFSAVSVKGLGRSIGTFDPISVAYRTILDRIDAETRALKTMSDNTDS